MIFEIDMIIDEEINISLSELHSSKTFFSIKVTEDGIEICANEEHLLNASLSIFFILDGLSNEICINDVHS